MTKVLILYYSAYGHMERMAHAVAEGVRDAGVEADIKRVPEFNLSKAPCFTAAGPTKPTANQCQLLAPPIFRAWCDWVQSMVA